MRKIILFIITNVVFTFAIKAQVPKHDIFTPNRNPVLTYEMRESSSSVRAGFDSQYINAYPNALPIYTYPPYSSTSLFNCHGYAFLIVEGKPARWLGLTNNNRDPDIHITDSSYIDVPQAAYPGKVFWTRPLDHSAVTTAMRMTSRWKTLFSPSHGHYPPV